MSFGKAELEKMASVVGPPPATESERAAVVRYRAVVHAWK
jgi:hypothetical protein